MAIMYQEKNKIPGAIISPEKKCRTGYYIFLTRQEMQDKPRIPKRLSM